MSMDIEDLNKSQIILLTLLVSFVTSIATGIVTVSLMQKAPKDVVRVMQRVVERTVEKVESAKPSKDPKPTEKIIEKTIVVKEGDLIAQAIAENRNKVLKIIDKDSAQFLAFAISLDGAHIVSDAKLLAKEQNLQVQNAKGERQDIEVLKSGGARGLALFKLSDPAAKLPTVKPSDASVQLGQSIFAFLSPSLDKVTQAIVSSNEDSFLLADIDADAILPGMLIFNSNGQVLGMSTEASRQTDPQAFVGASAIQAFESTKDQEEAGGNTDTQNDSEEEQGADSTNASSSAQLKDSSDLAASAADALDESSDAKTASDGSN